MSEAVIVALIGFAATVMAALIAALARGTGQSARDRGAPAVHAYPPAPTNAQPVPHNSQPPHNSPAPPRTSSARLIVRMVISGVIAGAVVLVSMEMRVRDGTVEAYVVLGIFGLFTLIALISSLRLFFRFFIWVFVR